MNPREARFSQPKRELFGLKEALRLNKRWLFGVRKLIVEMDAKYIKGMIENPDMMLTATINRWIDEILMYHFTLRHKAGATFGPDGLSRWSVQPDDPPFEPCSDDEDEDIELPQFEVADPSEPQPFDISEFVDKIDTRTGYFHGIARNLTDFAEELNAAKAARDLEKANLQCGLNRAQGEVPKEQVLFVQQLVNALALPLENDAEKKEKPYDETHQSVTAINQDRLVPFLEEWIQNKAYKPKGFDEKQLKKLARLGARFLMFEGRLYRRGLGSQHRLYVPKKHRTYMMTAAHDHNGHRGFFATKSLLTQRFWWPEMERDINQFVKTCHPCQERQHQLVRIPPSKTRTPGIFEILHADVMHMTPASNGCKYIAHRRCGLTSYAEGRALKDQKGRSIALWMYEDILCRWGGLEQIVTDNGEPFKAATHWIESKWGIKHIKISPYNSQANGAIERPHWDIRQMLYKATGDKNVNKWFWFLDAVLWADRISVRRRTGYSPYFMVTGTHPILPLDAAEATWLIKLPTGVMSEDDLIGTRARALAKHKIHVDHMKKHIDQEKLKRLVAYERDFKAVIKDFKFEPGDLVLIRNTAIESSLDKKMKARYNGPMIVVARNKGGSYIVAEMSGAVLRQKIARFRVVPYFARKKIDLPEGIMSIIDADELVLGEIGTQPEPEVDLERDYLMSDVRMEDSEGSDDE